MFERQPEERGAAALEFVLLVPALMLIASLVIGGGRLWQARTAVEAAAASAARAASVARTPAEAEKLATTVTNPALANAGVHCAQHHTTLDTAALSTPSGRSGFVAARVSCELSLSDLLLPGWPGTVTVSASENAVVDTYRRRF